MEASKGNKEGGPITNEKSLGKKMFQEGDCQMLLRDRSIVLSFLLLGSSSLCDYTKMCLAIHLLMDFWVVSTLRLLQLNLLQILYTSLWVDKCCSSFLLKYVGER